MNSSVSGTSPSNHQLRVTFQPQGRSVFVLSGTKLLEAAGRVGLPLQTPCGGAGTCGKCRVQIMSGACEASPAEKAALTAAEIDDGWRLACQMSVCRDCVVHVPATSLFADSHQILIDSAQATAPLAPAVRKQYVRLQPPSLEDERSDLSRIGDGVGVALRSSAQLLRDLPARLRERGFEGTAVIAGDCLIDFEPGDTHAACYGVAMDVGTTTVVGSLLDLTTGDELAVAATINGQTRYGDDLISRIAYARGGSGEAQRLGEAVIESIEAVLADLCEQAGVDRGNIYDLAAAGNTVMQHLLCGLDVRPLGEVPFAPTVSSSLVVPAASLGLGVHSAAMLYVMPVIGGYVGGDTVAGVMATRLGEADGARLLIDIGTNGEIVLAAGGQLLAASTAAGPAFEGARISCGMRASGGAIENVIFDGDVRCSVIGNQKPVGLCGSGLIDAAAEMLRHGIVSSTGRMLPPEELPPELPAALRERLQRDSDGRMRFLLAGAAGQDGVYLHERDIRELQLAVAAIRAGTQILLGRAGLSAGDLSAVLVAGGFGSFIRRSNAQRIGLLPPGLDHRRIHYVGNTSLEGARWALLSTQARQSAEALAGRIRHVQLSADLSFQAAFADAMLFPSQAG